MKQILIRHLTEYHFTIPTTLLEHRLLVTPRENRAVRVVESHLSIRPNNHVRWQRDPLDNTMALVSFSEPAELLSIESVVLIEHSDDAPLDFIVAPDAVRHPFDYRTEDARVLAPFLAPCWPNEPPELARWLARFSSPGLSMETFVLLQNMTRALHSELRYQVRNAPGVQSPNHTLALGTGSCRDYAALLMEACRHLGLAARFVSGYLEDESMDAHGSATGSTHAWVEVYLPGPGWKGFDPTHGELAGPHHIAVAVSDHPERIPPVAGSFVPTGGPSPEMRVSVRVERQSDQASL